MEKDLKAQISDAYDNILRNKLYINELRTFILIEVREHAVQISMRKLDFWDKIYQIESNIDRVLPIAIEAGYDNVLSYALARDPEYVEAEEIIKLIDNKIQKPDIKGNIHLLEIPTKASPDEILNFWFKLQGDNEKGQPYWESEQEIVHFVNQNFKGFPGVSEVRRFTPNMNKSELNQVVWTFFDTYKVSKGKKQYEQLLLRNFTRFEGDKNIYGNIKDYNIQHLKKLFK